VTPANPQEEQIQKNLQTTCLTNRAFVELFRGDYAEASGCCNAVLQIDPKNFKAYLRRAQAFKVQPIDNQHDSLEF
jgi:Tfp pilus assembly protein PilF